MPLLVLGLDVAFLALDVDPVLVLDPVATFLALDPLLDLDAAFLALDADLVLGLDPVPAFLAIDADLVLGLDPVPAFLALDPVPSLSRSLPFLGEFTNHLFLGLFIAWVLGPFC
jgi:hypothetical protein